MRNSIWISVLLMWASCSTPLVKNSNFTKLVKSKPYTVVMFIAPDCPLCKTLANPYTEMAIKFPEVQFLAVHSGTNYEAMELNMFATENAFKPFIFRDLDYAVAHQLGATVTPEFVLLDSNETILYQGLFDDRMLVLGSYKQQWNKHYLEDALTAILKNQTPHVPKTEPVGCVLEY